MEDTRGKQSKWWTKLAGFGLWFLIQLLGMTQRVKSAKETGKEGESQSIIVFWHNRILPAGYLWTQVDKQFPMCILTSASKDGALVESVLRYFNIASVRGSTHRRASIGLLGMIQNVRAGKSVALTPDGPQGPVYRMNNGVIKIASTTGIPIIPLCIEFSSCWRIGSTWDGFCIPKPFSEIRLLWKAPVYIPRELTDEEQEAYRVRIEKELHEGLPDFEPLNFFNNKE